jgi:hypothetical protein
MEGDAAVTKTELKNRLISENIPEDMYSLDGGLPGERLCLGKTDSGWEVYYSERGLKTGRRQFDSEQDACEYFYPRLVEMLKCS